ncbi:hypothetical protein P8452_20382 [Trifolium repens]|nr:hypothetical protein P8452_20382 [Trifolium repens]
MLGAEAPPGRKGPDDLLANAMFQTILRLIYAGFSGLVYAGLDLCSVIKRKVQAALNERMQEYKRQIDQESQGLRGFFVLDSRGMLHYYRRQCRKLSMLQGYGAGAFLFLLSSESLLMGVTKCMCLGRPLTPSGNQAWI